ncbi:shikimate dehydrogenase [Maliponia aquimaris]|uniref:Shikimate dehydrogenase (NADP(+)) n=1 Tax=Maliponia aquimaris TaxID=1673631 RepID=A0A238L0V5_9RHOB|nr:shikimate dehydrogenase [Maliponia aquimaris]SMX48627.1 Shikimate dehydrogenase [Maliponia aquimaris]
MVSRISGRTRVIGLFGSPIGHSRSPLMQNTVFAAMGLDFVYVPFDTGARDAAEVVQAMRVLNLSGANVTMPLKRAILPHLDHLSPAADLAGAVNVIVNDGGVLTGHLTDGEGFMSSLAEAGVPYAGRRMVLLGAGGAGMAVAVQAALEGVSAITLVNRRDGFFEAAGAMVARVRNRLGCGITLQDLDGREALAEAIGAANILVNATPVGMHGAEPGMALHDAGLLRPGLVVCDLIYVPRETPLLAQAARRGCVTVSGLGMQLYQAVPAFRMWTGQEMDVELARRVLFEGAE